VLFIVSLKLICHAIIEFSTTCDNYPQFFQGNLAATIITHQTDVTIKLYFRDNDISSKHVTWKWFRAKICERSFIIAWIDSKHTKLSS